MGVNSGSFFGMMLCGYLAERIGLEFGGFGLAGVFMLLGTIQFWLSQPLFGDIGKRKQKTEENNQEATDSKEKTDEEKPNPFTIVDKLLIVISAIIGIGYALNDPLSKVWNIDLFAWAS